MNRLVKKVLQMYIGIEWNSLDEFDGWHPAKFLHTLCMRHPSKYLRIKDLSSSLPRIAVHTVSLFYVHPHDTRVSGLRGLDPLHLPAFVLKSFARCVAGVGN